MQCPPTLAGPSPRTQGAEAAAAVEGHFGGSIPARAGSGAPAPATAGRWVPIPACTGSSLLCLTRVVRGRSMPACAESRHRCFPHLPAAWAHPRVRGAGGALRRAVRGPGSIPARTGAVGADGSIPARCRDQQSVVLFRGAQLGPSPRVRREQKPGDASCDTTSGSIPRARGAVRGLRQSGLPAGVIPTCAGSSSPTYPVSRTVRVHPRVCEEQSDDPDWVFEVWGPFPHARGTARRGEVIDPERGPIPVCAGSRYDRPTPPIPCGGHPRTRGEQPTVSVAVPGHSL